MVSIAVLFTNICLDDNYGPTFSDKSRRAGTCLCIFKTVYNSGGQTIYSYNSSGHHNVRLCHYIECLKLHSKNQIERLIFGDMFDQFTS